MHVALLGDFLPYGGARTYFSSLLALCRKQGWWTSALIPHLRQGEQALPGIEASDIEHYSPKPARSRAWLTQSAELPSILKFLRRCNPDVVIVSVGDPQQFLTPLFLPWPTLHILHSCIWAPPSWKTRPLYFLLHKALSPHRRMLAVSHFAAASLKRYWGVESTVLHNPTTYPEAVFAAKRQQGKHILTVGNIEPHKNPEGWLKAARLVLQRHPDASFQWVGEGSELVKMRQVCEAIPTVHFSGASRRMPELYSRASVYCQPSLMENHSLAVLEAMSFALPCIVSDRGGQPESVVHGETGLLYDAEDPEALAEALCSLLENKTLADSMGRAGQARVREYFMPERWEREMSRIILETAAGLA